MAGANIKPLHLVPVVDTAKPLVGTQQTASQFTQVRTTSQFTQVRTTIPLIVDDRNIPPYSVSSGRPSYSVSSGRPPFSVFSGRPPQRTFINRNMSPSNFSSGIVQKKFDISFQSTPIYELFDSRNMSSQPSQPASIYEMSKGMSQGIVDFASQSTPRYRMKRNMSPQSTDVMRNQVVDVKNILPQLPPRMDMFPVTVQNKTVLPWSLHRQGMGTLVLKNRDMSFILPLSQDISKMVPSMPIKPVWNQRQMRNREPGYIRELHLIIQRYFEQVRHGTNDDDSFISSILRTLATHEVGYNATHNDLPVAVQEFQTFRPSTLYQSHQLCQSEIRSLFLLNLMYSLHVPKEALRPKPIIWNYDEEKEMSSKVIIDIFWITGLPKAERPRLGVAVCLVGGDPVPKRFVSEHENHAHAESTMIDYLRRVLISERVKGTSTPGQIVNIEVFQNYSPCGECSVKYCRLLGEFADHGICVKIIIHFVSMYKIYWDMTQSTPTLKWIPLYVHRRNRDELLKLKKAGVEMCPFTIDIWKKLLTVLDWPIHWNIMKLYIENERLNMDHETAKTFQGLLEYGASRSK